MAPDKIHIDEDLINYHCLADHLNESEIVYIRKDALLEWLQQGFDWIKNPVISVQQIIDKLNSL